MSTKAGGAVAGRRQRAVDAAIEVIAADGLRGLTHRAVDVRAGLPPGSTSSVFRTRTALLGGVLDRLVELDEAVLRDVPVTGWGSTAEIAELLTGLLTYWLGPARSRTVARLELYLDATRRAELTPELRAANRRFRDRTAEGMRAAGLPDPDESARILLAQLDGLLYDALARPFAGGAEPERLRRAVDVMLRGHLG